MSLDWITELWYFKYCIYLLLYGASCIMGSIKMWTRHGLNQSNRRPVGAGFPFLVVLPGTLGVLRLVRPGHPPRHDPS